MEIIFTILAIIISLIISFIAYLSLVHHNIVVLLLIIITCIIIHKKYNKFRGFFGEFWVKRELNKLPKDEYIVLNDIMINNNGTHQIDHIVISKYGIFVIEMKNFYGIIIGKEKNDKWIQKFRSKKFYFPNPIHQNYGHIKTLEELLKIDYNKFISIVCFSNQVKLKVESNTIVTQLDFINEKIKENNEIKINVSIKEIAETINKYNIKDKKERKKHIKIINTRIKEDNYKINNMICPKCGGKLVSRKSKYGEFLGCSNYPKCRFIKR